MIRYHKGKYEVEVYLGRDTKGNKKRIFKRFLKKSDAKKWEREVLQRKEENGELLNDKILLPEMVNNFLEFVKNTRPSTTYASYRSDLSSKLSKHFEFSSMNSINMKQLNHFVDNLVASGLSPRSINRTISSSRSFFDWATNSEEAVLYKNPARGLKKLPIHDNPEIKYWNNYEIELFLNEIHDHCYKDLFIFILNTGLRISEVLGLTVDKFYSNNNVISIDMQLSKYIPREKLSEEIIEGAYVFGPLKNGLPRKLALNEVASNIIENRCQNKRGDDFIFEPLRKRESDLRKIIYKRGIKPLIKDKYCLISNHFYKDVFLQIIKEANLKSIGLHGLRHTFASQFMMNGGDLYELKNILGHKNISNTEIYAHLSPDYLARSRNIVNIG